jgi:DNA repair photolyase
VLVAPLIPVLTDGELETILTAARAAGAQAAGYVLLRLPHELNDMFAAWLATHRPDMARHVLNRLRDARGGQLYVSQFGERMRGTGEYAGLLARRFAIAERRLGFGAFPDLDCSQFTPPRVTPQLELF